MKSVSKAVLATACFCLLLISSREVKADVVTFSTTGVFTCGGCIVAGSTVTFGNVTLRFLGITPTTVNTGPEGFTFASFGAVQFSNAGDAATQIPLNTSLSIQVTQSAPGSGTGQFVGVINGSISKTTSTGELKFVATSFSIGAIKYDIDMTFKLVPPFTNSGVTTIQGKITATPEPSAIVIFGTSLLGAAGVLRLRRRRI